MRKIVLIRHAKSSWDNQHLKDHDRPLARRGWDDLPIMAKRLKARKIFPDLVLCSTALRAQQTAEIIIRELDVPDTSLVLEPGLYHGSAAEILSQIQKQEIKFEIIFVIGHNPGFNDFIEFMGATISNLPTAGQVGFETSSNSWQELSAENTETWFIDYPKK